MSPCPRTPNCVCSQDDTPRHAAAPLRFEGDAGEAWARLGKIVGRWPRTTIVQDTGRYLHAECKTRVFRFTDDVEFALDADAGVIHVRSAARIGRSDLGVNRRRVEAIRREFERGA